MTGTTVQARITPPDVRSPEPDFASEVGHEVGKHRYLLGRRFDVGDPTAQEKDDLTISTVLDIVIAVAESPVELRRLVIPLVDADLDHRRPPWRRRDERLGRPDHRCADAEALKRWKDAEGPEMDDAFRRLSAEVEAEPSNGLPVRKRQKEEDIVASLGHCLSHVVGLDRLLAVPLKAVEIPVAERSNLDQE